MLPDRILNLRVVVHVVDMAMAVLISALTQGPRSPFFSFFTFVLLSGALRWGFPATIATGAAVVIWFAIDASLIASSTEFNWTTFAVRGAYLLVTTAVLAQFAGTQGALYAERHLLSRLLAGIRRSTGFSQTLEDAIGDCLKFTGATTALVALANTDDDRAYAWTVRLGGPAPLDRRVPLELAPPDRDALLFPVPPAARVWFVRRSRDRSLHGHALGSRRVVQLEPYQLAVHVPLLDRHDASSCIVVRTQLPDWHTRLFLFDPTQRHDSDLRFLERLASYVAPAVHSQYATARLRTRMGDVVRARMARELHDRLLQSLIGIEMQMEATRRGADPVAANAGVPSLATMQQQLHEAILVTRDLMTDMRQTVPARNGLLGDVSAAVERFRTDTGIDARLSSEVDEVVCRPRTGLEIVRIVQEALVNIRKHSAATHVPRARRPRRHVVEYPDRR